MNSLINKHLHEINKICLEAGISYLAVFGSQVREEAKKDSDVDLLVEFKETPGLISFIHIKNQFEDVLKKKVDLITRRSLSKYLASYVTKDLQQIYG